MVCKKGGVWQLAHGSQRQRFPWCATQSGKEAGKGPFCLLPAAGSTSQGYPLLSHHLTILPSPINLLVHPTVAWLLRFLS